MLKLFYYKILSHLPNKDGQESLQELKRFMAREGGIEFKVKQIRDESGIYFYAESINIKDKHIITTGRNLYKLEHNIKDAVFSAFKVPTYYCDFNSLVSPLNQELKLQYATR